MSIELSGQALDAYNHRGPFLALGGPGSGKTTLALLKASRLAPALKPGQRILFLSFSRAAVQQVLTSCGKHLTSAERKLVSVQTYHAFCLDLLRTHGRLLTGLAPQVLYPGDEQLHKAEFTGDWAAETARLAHEEGVFAFNEFADAAGRMIGGSNTIAKLVADKYPFIILDEFQDTADAQWILVQRLAHRSELIFLADPEQRIFDYDPHVDPLRLEQLKDTLHPAVFDLGGANHRSPNAGILSFANAVLRNEPAPAAHDVATVTYRPQVSRGDERTVHLEVIRMFAILRKMEVTRPVVAVLARSNGLVARISTWLACETHKLNGKALPPVAHDVVWDADLAASAAVVVGTILEWPKLDQVTAVARTLDAVADFGRMQNAVDDKKGNKTATDRSRRLSEAASSIREGGSTRIKVANHLLDCWAALPPQLGDPRRDWLTARDILQNQTDLAGVLTHARFTRLFGATDEIGGKLSQQWQDTTSYHNAPSIVRRALEARRLAGEAKEPHGCVVMNIHKSKGKEFDGVVIVEGQYAGTLLDPRFEQPPFLASRRLLRVGITRARHRVVIVRPNTPGTVPLTPKA